MDASVADYAEHLTKTDLRLLSDVVPVAGGATAALARDPVTIERLLADPRVFDAVFGPDGVAAGHAVLVSPFLAFGVAVHRAVADLAGVDYLPERSGLRQRVPVFDTPQLRDFLGSAARRLFLAELLASFTRVASGRYRVRSGGRSRTRRFSELDPVLLAGMLEAVPDESRPGIYRRLGDVSLFLAGVFPDYAAAHALGPLDAGRLLRSARVPAAERDGLAAAPALELLEYLGARWYRAALAAAPVRTANLAVVGEVAARFHQARRILNHLADRYLLGPGGPWFAPSGPKLAINPGIPGIHASTINMLIRPPRFCTDSSRPYGAEGLPRMGCARAAQMPRAGFPDRQGPRWGSAHGWNGARAVGGHCGRPGVHDVGPADLANRRRAVARRRPGPVPRAPAGRPLRSPRCPWARRPGPAGPAG